MRRPPSSRANALAVAVAHDEAEEKRLAATLARMPTLRDRAVAALAGGRADLASEAAGSIATMEDERIPFSRRVQASQPSSHV